MSQISPIYIRISADDLTLARPTSQNTPVYRHRLNRRVSFTLNLREALAAAPMEITADATLAEVYATAPVCVVPLTEFNESEAAEHYATTFRAENKNRILCDGIPTLESVLIYAIPESVFRTLEDTFSQIRYHNALTPILQRGPMTISDENTILAYIHEDQTDAILWKGRKLLVINNFTTKHINDAVFFILGMSQAIGIPAAELRAIVVGEKRKRVALIEALSSFVTTSDGNDSSTLAAQSSENPIPYPLACALTLPHTFSSGQK